MTQDYPAIRHLLGAGFHQDVWEDFDSWQAVVSAFTSDPVFCARLPLEVKHLLSLPDEELSQVMGAMDDAYTRMAFDLPLRDWLQQVAEQVERERPEPDSRYAALVGRKIDSVTVVEDGDRFLRVALEGNWIVDFLSGVGVRAAGPGVLAPALVPPEPPRGKPKMDPVAMVAEGIGEDVLAAGGSAGRLYLATASMRVRAAKSGPEPWFTIHRPDGSRYPVAES